MTKETSFYTIVSQVQYLPGLYANGCNVGDKGAKEIANALKASLHLETLCLGHNTIGDEGASALTRVVAENYALRR